MALSGALTRLADELTNQYRITYGRPDTLIPPEKIEVSVRRPGLTVRGTPIKSGKDDRGGTASVAVAGVGALAMAMLHGAVPAPGARPGRGCGPAAQQLPAFRASVDVVSLSVTVTDPSGRYVTDLTRDQFHVFEDGAEQEVTTFNRKTVPIALALLLDTSASMSDRMGTAQEAAIGFARRLGPEDLGELVGFSYQVQVLQGFTSDQDALERAVRKTMAGGPTPLYQAVYISLKELKKIRAASAQEIRRQAIVVFTDGEDTSSLVAYDELLDLAKRSETAHLHDRAADAARGRPPRRTRTWISTCANSRRKPAAARSSPPASSTWPPSTARSPTNSPTNTSSATCRRTRNETGPGAACRCAWTARARRRGHGPGYFGPTRRQDGSRRPASCTGACVQW